MRPIETIPGMGKGEEWRRMGGGEFKYNKLDRLQEIL
jgi:hypothetical protein